MTDNSYTLKLANVTKRYDEFTAVDNLSLGIRPGRVFGLLGPNGAGKTTTIRMIVNITAPDEGHIELFGKPLTPALQDRIGYLPEERGLYKKMKVGEQLQFFGALKNLSGKTVDKKIDYWLERVELSDWKNHKAADLSKGMQQKIQFIAAVMHDPDLLILDEPFSGLDPVNVELLMDIIKELKASNKTLIFSTHLMETAEKLCDDICLINRSRKVLDGTLREVKQGFGGNSVSLRVTGGAEVLADKSLVAQVKENSDDVEALLAPHADAQELLRRLIAADAAVTKFELLEPSLHQIFVAKVKNHVE